MKNFHTAKNILCALSLFASISSFAQTGSLKGNVKDSTGNPIDSAVVVISEKSLTGITDKKGDYVINNIPAGKYTAIINMIGYSPAGKQVSIQENETATLNFELMGKTNELKGVTVNGTAAAPTMGYLGEVHNGVIYSGEKNAVLTLDNLNANTAEDNPRQVLGRIPGSNYSETEGGGFPSNGIGFRGLNPTQSIETNTREDGYNITGDIYGYPESYYLPPYEALQSIEVTQGASALEFGPQFGGVINYIVKDAPADRTFQYTTETTGGSYGLLNSFNSVGGTYKKWSYYAFAEAEYNNGWRPNSQMEQFTGFGRLEYRANKKFKIGVEYSALRNLLHMPGGLDDAEFNQNSDQSFRTRNWLTTPWNVITLTSEYHITDKTTLNLTSAVNLSSRDIVWRNEDGGPGSPDSISNNAYSPREVEHEYFKSSTTELRMVSNYSIGGKNQVLDAGVRFFYGWMNREEGGVGTTGTNFDLTDSASYYANNLDFTTLNVAPYVQNTFHIGNRLSITPGFRFEYLKSTATGYVTLDDGSILNVDNSKPRYIPLGGLTMQYKTSANTNIYGDISQAYTPIEYSYLYPLGFDIDAKIDPNLKDINGYNADLGWRGSVRDYLNFDVSGFYMAYNNAIAFETFPTYVYETNVADAVHKGVETYVELNIVKLFTSNSKVGTISFFNSFAYDNAKYVNGLYQGNWAEFAPQTINRFGLTYTIKGFSTTYLISSVSKSFSDANNTVFSPDAEVGVMPAYTVMDWSATVKIKNYNIKFGINNVANTPYFTIRTVEYPGPGIIPSEGRNVYVGFGATF